MTNSQTLVHLKIFDLNFSTPQRSHGNMFGMNVNVNVCLCNKPITRNPKSEDKFVRYIFTFQKTVSFALKLKFFLPKTALKASQKLGKM